MKLNNHKNMAKTKKENPLTLNELAKYNKDILFPFMQENFVTKREFESFVDIVATKEQLNALIENVATKDDLKNYATKDDVTEFKDEILTGQDKILEKLDILLGEKPMKDAQDKRKQKVLEIHNGALKRNKILSPEEALQIDQMGAF